MIGVGGWGGRNEKSGPYVYWEAKAAKVVRDIAKDELHDRLRGPAENMTT